MKLNPIKLILAKDTEIRNEQMQWGIAKTPFGICAISFWEGGICELIFIHHSEEFTLPYERKDELAISFIEKLFSDDTSEITLVLQGTDFQVSVWKALLSIPYGTTCSYHELAAHMQSPRATRAVASAIAKNKIALLIPCHRVILANGSIGQYRWGAELKETLLKWERG